MTDTSGTAKTSKVVPSPKTATTSEVDVTEDNKKEKPVKEIPMIHDAGFFQHETGDTYEGEFEAKKKDHSVKMHGIGSNRAQIQTGLLLREILDDFLIVHIPGQGVYTTAEGDTYSGLWDADKIVATDQTIITYNDGAKFEGLIKDWGYTGRGIYTYPDGSILKGEFSDNCPVGNLILTDPNGHTWLGKAEHGFGWFEPLNHFYELLETTQTRIKRRHKSVPAASNIQATSAKPTPASTKATSPSTKASVAKSKPSTKKK